MLRKNVPWLEALLAEAKQKNWCLNANCTTCGCIDIRARIAERSAEFAGVGFPPMRRTWTRRFLEDLGHDDHLACVVTITKALATLPPQEWGSYEHKAVRLILTDLHRAMWPFLGIIETELEGTWAGAEYEELQDESRENLRRAEGHERQQKEDRQIAAARRAKRARERKAAVETRAHVKAERDRRRRAFLDELATLDPKTRIERLLNYDVEFPIGAVPANLIPDSKDLVRLLEPHTRVRLIKTIGRRKGAWAPLGEVLAAIESAPEGSLS